MGRFSRLETGESAPASAHPAPDLEVITGGPGGHDSFPAENQMDASGCVALGDRTLFMDETRSALRWYSRAVDLDSTRMDAWTRMIQTLVLRGELSDAAAWIGRALTAYPETPSLLGFRAVERARRGLIREAMAGSDAATEKGASDPVVWMARGQVLLLAENGNANFCFDQAIKQTRGDDWKTPAMIALILRERRICAKAIDYLRQASERQERQPLVWFQIGLCRAALGHRAQSERAFETARELCDAEDPLLRRIDRAGSISVWRWMRGLLHRG